LPPLGVSASALDATAAEVALVEGEAVSTLPPRAWNALGGAPPLSFLRRLAKRLNPLPLTFSGEEDAGIGSSTNLVFWAADEGEAATEEGAVDGDADAVE